MKPFFAPLICALFMSCALSVCQAGTREDIAADMKAGRWTQAESRLDEVLKKHPENASGFYWRAQVRLRQGKMAEAREDLATAKRLDPALKFSGNKLELQNIERQLEQGSSSRVPSAENTAATPGRAATPAAALGRDASQEPRRSSFSLFWACVWAVVIVGGIVMLTRFARSRGASAELARVRRLLEEARNDLRDASAAIDSRAGLDMEQKLALSDRLVRAQGDLTAHLNTLNANTDFSQSHALIARVRDIAAEVRGEERPSDIAARRQMEREQMAAHSQQPGYGHGAPGRSGLGMAGGVLGGLAAGAVLGSVLGGSGSAHASAGEGHGSRNDDSGGSGLDLSGADDGGWDVGGSDSGGSWDLGGSSDGGSFD